MEALFQGSYLLTKPPKTATMPNSLRFNFTSRSTNYFSSSFSSSPHFSLLNKPRSLSLVTNATNKDKKQDSHSFVPKLDEVTGFFPESVLLKKKEVEEDGKFLPEFEDEDERKLYESLALEVETDMDVELLRHYEIVYLIHEKHEEEVASVNEKVQEFLREKKGRVWRFSDWGMRSLSYKIQKANNAHYILMNFELDAKYINDFKNLLDKDERVIRHVLVKKDEAITEDCPPPPEYSTLGGEDGEDDDEDEEDDDWDDEDEEEDDYDDDDGVIIIDDDDVGMIESQILINEN
ncbi:unnamed protein product [Lathyrus oleraceus]|uniref:30S ribosomal protein S6 n=1 Tax=Pisum sativum TaxID=3888 RepID=A0A9D5BN81_PEA|nr:protein REGULATOR OF FATTY ACID COMPOSITION 3, chloroplastic-like [Pisum sativum]KAI5446621.1 hypothetical protein KIW84_014456 [Pisum sativum]